MQSKQEKPRLKTRYTNYGTCRIESSEQPLPQFNLREKGFLESVKATAADVGGAVVGAVQKGYERAVMPANTNSIK